MKKAVSLIFILIFTFCLFTACDPDAEEIDWENIKLGYVLPEPQSNLMEVLSNSDDNLLVYIHQMSENDYLEYQRCCENDKGFDVEAETIGTSFYAYNQDGYYLSLYYNDSQDEMHITLDAPIPMEDYELPEYAVAAGLPVPSSGKGHFNWQNTGSFFLYVGETTKEDYMCYKDACVSAGFTVDPYENNTVYSAANTEGYKVSLNYKGFNIFTLEFHSPKESADNNTEDTTAPANTAEAPDDWTNLLEKHYEEVKKKFEDAGFTNITCVTHEIDYNENNVFEGSVVNIAIGENGEICTFEKGEQWPKDIKIRIDYRVKPKGEDNPESEVTSPEDPTVSNPYNKVDDYAVYTKSEYAHIDSDVIRLGNGERVWITIEASPSALNMDDFIVDYDDTMLEIIDVTSSTSGNTLEIELVIKAKKSGVSEIIIGSGYELYADAENAMCYVLTVNGLDSHDGRIVYVTSTGEKYHYSASCVSSRIKTTLSDALAYEYEPCSKCVN